MRNAENRGEASVPRDMPQSFSGPEGAVPARARVRALPDDSTVSDAAMPRRMVSLNRVGRPTGEQVSTVVADRVSVTEVEVSSAVTPAESPSAPDDLQQVDRANPKEAPVPSASTTVFPDAEVDSPQATGVRDHALTDAEFVAHFEEMRAALMRHALHIMRDVDDAEDLVQETFVNAWKGRDGFKKGTNMSAWLHKICNNGGIDIQRRKKRIKGVMDTTDEVPEPITAYAMTANDPTAGMDREVDKAEVREALRRIHPEFATAILWADGHELTQREVAESIGVPFGTAQSRVFRGRRDFRKVIEQMRKERKGQD